MDETRSCVVTSPLMFILQALRQGVTCASGWVSHAYDDELARSVSRRRQVLPAAPPPLYAFALPYKRKLSRTIFSCECYGASLYLTGWVPNEPFNCRKACDLSPPP